MIKIFAYVWDCGDDVCSCRQGIIEQHTILDNGQNVIKRLWEGTFFTDGEGWNQACQELKDEAGRRRISLDEKTMYGELSLDTAPPVVCNSQPEG